MLRLETNFSKISDVSKLVFAFDASEMSRGNQGFVFKQARACALRSVTTSSAGGRVEFTLTIRTYCFVYVFVCFSVCLCQDRCLSRILHLWLFEPNNFARLWTAAEIEGMTSFDSNYQNAFRCNLCNVDLCHSSMTEYNSLPQSILVVVAKWRHLANVFTFLAWKDVSCCALVHTIKINSCNLKTQIGFFLCVYVFCFLLLLLLLLLIDLPKPW